MFIKNSQYRKLRDMAKAGDARAKEILDAYYGKSYGCQEDIDAAINGYFRPTEETASQPVVDEIAQERALRDKARQRRDMQKALETYTAAILALPEDDKEIDIGCASKVRDAINDTNGFHRYWDDEDKGESMRVLTEMAETFGRMNVIEALNKMREEYGE